MRSIKSHGGPMSNELSHLGALRRVGPDFHAGESIIDFGHGATSAI